MKKTALALFDFDGTVTRKDSLVDFLLFDLGKFRFFFGFLLLSPLVALYLLKMYSQERMKITVLRLFYRGRGLGDFEKACQKYDREKLPAIIRPEAQEKINWHLKNGHQVAIVTATLKYYLKDWCQKQNITLIGSEIEVKNGRITGKLVGKVCAGEEKVRRIKEKCHLDEFVHIYAYGNSQGDLPMLALAQEKYYNWKKI
ncbi:MAG: HAD-IB family hydrolase [Candidatus Moranbacteria bacterium]|nr:HAD-IB family hydrolase [Candidatus Moranbacteria bacterium]